MSMKTITYIEREPKLEKKSISREATLLDVLDSLPQNKAMWIKVADRAEAKKIGGMYQYSAIQAKRPYIIKYRTVNMSASNEGYYLYVWKIEKVG